MEFWKICQSGPTGTSTIAQYQKTGPKGPVSVVVGANPREPAPTIYFRLMPQAFGIWSSCGPQVGMAMFCVQVNSQVLTRNARP